MGVGPRKLGQRRGWRSEPCSEWTAKQTLAWRSSHAGSRRRMHNELFGYEPLSVRSAFPIFLERTRQNQRGCSSEACTLVSAYPVTRERTVVTETESMEGKVAAIRGKLL